MASANIFEDLMMQHPKIRSSFCYCVEVTTVPHIHCVAKAKGCGICQFRLRFSFGANDLIEPLRGP